MVGAETIPYFSEVARQKLQSIPTILIDYPVDTPSFRDPTVHIQTAVHGVESPGTIYRMDNVPMSLGSFRSTALPTDEFVLDRIRCECTN